MNRDESIALLKSGRVEEWNWQRKSREKQLGFETNLRYVDLSGLDLGGANLENCNLRYANFGQSNLSRANLNGAYLSNAALKGANLHESQLKNAYVRGANLAGANLSKADLGAADCYRADFSGTNLTGVILSRANLYRADLREANLERANLSGASLGRAVVKTANFHQAHCLNTNFAFLDLSEARSLATVEHSGPSAIDMHTFIASHGKIPAEFLRGCGLQPWQIELAKLYDPRLSPAEITDIQYRVFDLRTSPILSGCFISYSHEDSEFVDALYQKLHDEGGSVWLDKHNFIAGSVEQNIDRAIRVNDILLLVVSAASLGSPWVWDEVESAFEKEIEQNRRIICPIAIDDSWKSAPADKRRLMRKITERIILDFSDWKSPSGELSEDFRGNYRKLIDGLKVHFGETVQPT